MKGFIIISALVACTLARPDIGLNIRNGYQYLAPNTPTGSYLPGTGSIGASTHQFQTINYNQGNTGLFGNGNQQTYQQTYQHNGYQQQQTQVNKQIYFYDSPEDLPAPTIRISGGGGVTQKNHKIIFIKAPAYQAPQVPQIPIQQQNEEKTRVYVLVKKPDEAQDIVVPTLAPSQHSKPEVFFIKYKTQQEAEAHVQNIQNGNHGGDSAHSVESSDSFVRTITDSKVNTGSNHIGSLGNDPIIFNNNHDNTFGLETKTISTNSNFGPAGVSGPYP